MSKCNCGGTQPPEVGNRHRTLRLALAMRGGVSLAVWIGGAVAEIDLFRRACNTNAELPGDTNAARRARALKYVELLKRTKYQDVRVDILAGASAGGLNAVLFGLAQTCGTIMDETVRKTWIDRGGIWDLLWDPGFGRIPSLLKGDEQFFVVVKDALKKVVETTQEDGPKPAERVTVELAATLLDDPYNPKRSNRASFSFTKTAGSLASNYTTIPCAADVSTDGGSVALNRMALAARATSSFPGAFKPADIHSELGDRPYGKPGVERTVNMSRAFLYSREEPTDSSKESQSKEQSEPFNVVDGGIYDNIPIDRAIRAIQRAPAAQPTERRLVYLDPEPPILRDAIIEEKRSSAVSWLSVIRSSMALKQREESAADELADVRTHNDSVMRGRGRLEALATVLRRIESSTGEDESCGSIADFIGEEQYRQCRIGMDPSRIADLLTDPWSELCQPPREAVDYAALGPKKAVQIKKWLQAAYNDATINWRLTDDVYAMLDRVRLLIAWVQALEGLREQLAEQPDRPPEGLIAFAGELMVWKKRLYRCLTVLIEAKRRALDAVLAGPLATDSEYDGAKLKTALMVSRYAQTRLTLTPLLGEILRAENPNMRSDADLYDELASWQKLPMAGGAHNFEHIMTSTVETLHQRIKTVSSDFLKNATPEDGWPQEWEESVFRHFYQGPLKDLATKELSKLFAVTGIPSTASVIAYHEITSKEPPAIDVRFLEEGAKAKLLGAWLRQLPNEKQMGLVLARPDQLVGADAKLAGNVAARFGGFLLARWRENDWQWGRLDAAAGIARMLNSTREEPMLDCVLRRDYVEPLQESILRESERTVQNHNGAIVQSVGSETLDAVSPHYRFALASRIVPLIYRALLPPRESGASVGAIVSRVLLYGVRPVAVPLPLVADSLRLAFGVVVIVGSATLLGAAPTRNEGVIGFSVILGIATAIVGWRAYEANKRWNDLSDQLGRIPRPVATDWKLFVDDAKRRKKWYFALTGVLMVGLIAPVVTHWLMVNLRPDDKMMVPLESFAVAVFFAFGSQHWLNKQIYRMSSRISIHEGVGRITLRFLAVATAACVALLAEHIARSAAKGEIPDYVPPAPFVAAATVALLTGISLWRWVRNDWVAICIVAGAALGGVAQWGLEAWPDWRLFDLLPTFIWMLGLGIIGPCLKVRPSEQNYPETNKPEITDPAAP